MPGNGAEQVVVEDENDDEGSIYMDYEEYEYNDVRSDDDVEDDDGDITKLRVGNNEDYGSEIHVHVVSQNGWYPTMTGVCTGETRYDVRYRLLVRGVGRPGRRHIS